ncbi:MAG: ROK family protein [Candidatus Dormibacteria bacterium]
MNPEAVIALDVGGTLVKAALVGRDGTRRGATVSNTGASDGVEAVIDRLAGVIADLRDTAVHERIDVAGIGVATPGLVDSASGLVLHAANLGWTDVPAADLLCSRCDADVHLAHDVRMAALAERQVGAAAGHDDVLLLTVGTGIGGAVMLGGEIRPGAHHRAGELGHFAVAGLEEVCPCGRTGCLELVASCRAIERRYRARSGEDVDVATVVARARSGDAAAGAVWEDAVEALASAIDSAVVFFDPEVVVVGGGIVALPSDLVARLNQRVGAADRWQPAAPVVAAALGAWAGCVGTGLDTWMRVDDVVVPALEVLG